MTLGNAKSICLFATKRHRHKLHNSSKRAPNFELFSHRSGARPGCLLLRLSCAKQPDVPPDYYIVPDCDLRSDPAKFGSGLVTIKRRRGFSRKTSQSIATTGKFLTRNCESEQSRIASSNFRDFESMSVRIHGKKLSGLG